MYASPKPTSVYEFLVDRVGRNNRVTAVRCTIAELQGAYRFNSSPRNGDIVMSVPTYRASDVSVRRTNATGDDSAKRRSTWKFCAFVILLFLLVSVTISLIIVTVILIQKSSGAVQFQARVQTSTQKSSDAVQIPERVQTSLRVTSQRYTPELADPASPEFKAAATKFCNQLKETLLLNGSPLKGKDFSCNVLEIRNGSLIFIYELVVPRSGASLGAVFNDLLAQFIIAQSKDGKVGTLSVDPDRECGVLTTSSSDEQTDAECPPIPSSNWTPGQDCYIPGTKQVRQDGAIVETRAFYNGTVDVTLSGIECQRWAAHDPHYHSAHGAIPCHFGTGETMEEVANYCRVVLPDSDDAPWCFTTDPDKRWELCNVTKCT